MKQKMTDKHKFAAFVLNTDEDFGYSMTDIARLMKVSQSTISNSIKEVKYRQTISDLQKELEMAKAEIRKEIPVTEVPLLPGYHPVEEQQ